MGPTYVAMKHWLEILKNPLFRQQQPQQKELCYPNTKVSVTRFAVSRLEGICLCCRIMLGEFLIQTCFCMDKSRHVQVQRINTGWHEKPKISWYLTSGRFSFQNIGHKNLLSPKFGVPGSSAAAE